MMVLKSFVGQPATLASRSRVVTATFMCALSAAVRLTSATEEGTKIPPPPVHAYNPLVSTMTAGDAPIFCGGQRPKTAQPIVLQMPRGCRAWPL